MVHTTQVYTVDASGDVPQAANIIYLIRPGLSTGLPAQSEMPGLDAADQAILPLVLADACATCNELMDMLSWTCPLSSAYGLFRHGNGVTNG